MKRWRPSLKQRLMLLFTASMTALCAAGGVYIVARAKDDIRGETRSAIDLVQRYLSARIELADVLSQRNGFVLPRLDLSQLRDVRHVRVNLYAVDGTLAETSAADRAGAEPRVPAPFARLVQRRGAAGADTHMPVVLAGVRVGEIVIHPDASYETGEIWNVASGLLGLLLAFYLATMALVWWAVARALRPLALVRGALQRLGAGRLDERLPTFGLPELAGLGGEFNRMAGTLEHSAAENRRLARQLIAAQEDERERIARELHDEIGQCITAIHADAAAIERGEIRDRAAARESAAAILSAAAQIKALLRAMLRRLRPAALAELGFGAALRELAAGFGQRHPEIACELRVGAGAADLRGETAVAAYRIVQESLTNVARHARAGSVRIDADIDNGAAEPRLSIRVADDGVGFEPARRGDGFGLAGMRERALALGGWLTIDGGDGARIAASLPLGGAR